MLGTVRQSAVDSKKESDQKPEVSMNQRTFHVRTTSQDGDYRPEVVMNESEFSTYLGRLTLSRHNLNQISPGILWIKSPEDDIVAVVRVPASH
jgi:hypothetical protein